MSIDLKPWIILLFILLCVKPGYAQDSLIHPEAVSPASMEEFESDGNLSFRMAFMDDVNYKIKTRFNYRKFELNYLSEGGEKEIKQYASLSWSSSFMTWGVGRGQPNIAKGLILGNTMMRFTPGSGSQAGIRPIKLKMKNYNYYQDLIFASVSVFDLDVGMFRYNASWCGFLQYRKKQWLAGAAGYGLEKPVLESWINYDNGKFKGSLDGSLSSGRLNHITSDMYYRCDRFRLFLSAAYLHPEFIALKPDSKWGSGLKAGSRGLAGGTDFSFSPWKISWLGYCILRDNYQEERCMLDLRYRKKSMEIVLSYGSKNILELSESDIFPFSLCWQEEDHRLCKFNMKYQTRRGFEFSYQFQGDVKHLHAYTNILRLTFKRSTGLLRLQVSHCRSCESSLYFLRPLTMSSYSIRLAPNKETVYWDLLYSRDIGTMKIYVLLRNEGVNMGFNYGL